jgi:GT2 family glycosyltransferase
MALRREVLDVTGAFDEGMPHWGSEDLELCLRFWLFGYEAWVVPEVEVGHYFRSRNPYHVEPVSVAHNQLRTAILHLGQARLERFIAAAQADPRYPRAMAQCIAGDTWTRRAELRGRRLHDDDWFFSNPHFGGMDMADAS